jgi:hypothetical protein
VDALRTAAEPLTVREIAERVLAAANIKTPDRGDLADLIGTINSSLRNHEGKGVQRTNEGSPAMVLGLLVPVLSASIIAVRGPRRAIAGTCIGPNTPPSV